jgi:hypothetical protein
VLKSGRAFEVDAVEAALGFGDPLGIMIHVTQSGPLDSAIVLRKAFSTSVSRAPNSLRCAEPASARYLPPAKLWPDCNIPHPDST